MKHVKWALIAVMLMTMVLAGCANNNGNQPEAKTNQPPGASGNDAAGQTGNEFAKRITFSASGLLLTDDGNYMNDPIYQTMNDKFNFEYKLIPITFDNWSEKNRLWVNSGDMPDMMFWDFNFKDYVNYTRQGLMKPLPNDYETKYPNLAKTIAKTGVADYLKTLDPEGRLYMIPNVIYNTPVTETTDIIIDPSVLFYRKDWAKKVGITVGDTITDQQIAELGKAFVSQDPGGNGPGKTIGFSGTPGLVYSAFVKTYNTYYGAFHKVDGQYVWGGFEESTLAGVKNLDKYFKEGFIDKDFYTHKGKEHYDKFDAGVSGMFIDGASAANVNERFQAFAKANPDIDPGEAIGLATVVGLDGQFHGSNTSLNYWAAEVFNPKLDDDTFHRILSILDYVATPEGQRLIFAGVEGQDYVMEGDKLKITREKDDNGNFKYIGDMYPSYNFFFTKVILPDDWSSQDPSLPDTVRDSAVHMFKVKEKITDLTPTDLDLTFFSAPNKDKFNVSVNDAITQVIMGNKDIDAAWSEWQKSVESKVNDVLTEINDALAK